MTDASEDVTGTEPRERVTDLRDLNPGDEVLMGGRSQPLTVTEGTTERGESSWTGVALEGPRGGVVTLDSVVEGLVRVSAVEREVAKGTRRDGARVPISHLSLCFHLREISEGSPADRNPDGLDEGMAAEALASEDPVGYLAAAARDPYRSLDARHTAEQLLSRHVTLGPGNYWWEYRCPECLEGEVLLTWENGEDECQRGGEPEPLCHCGREVPVPTYPGEDVPEDGVERSDRGARYAGPSTLLDRFN